MYICSPVIFNPTKMKIYEYVHSFFGVNFESDAICWY